MGDSDKAIADAKSDSDKAKADADKAKADAEKSKADADAANKGRADAEAKEAATKADGEKKLADGLTASMASMKEKCSKNVVPSMEEIEKLATDVQEQQKQISDKILKLTEVVAKVKSNPCGA